MTPPVGDHYDRPELGSQATGNAAWGPSLGLSWAHPPLSHSVADSAEGCLLCLNTACDRIAHGQMLELEIGPCCIVPVLGVQPKVYASLQQLMSFVVFSLLIPACSINRCT